MPKLTINGTDHDIDAPAEMPLLWAIRDMVGLTGTKFGCGVSQCGACTVHVDGVATRSCVTTIGSVGDKKITTIEGLAGDGNHPVQQAWISQAVPQCGYCQSGQIMTAAALLAKNPKPDDAAIDAAMSGNICRCGCYNRIKSAVAHAAELA